MYNILLHLNIVVLIKTTSEFDFSKFSLEMWCDESYSEDSWLTMTSSSWISSLGPGRWAERRSSWSRRAWSSGRTWWCNQRHRRERWGWWSAKQTSLFSDPPFQKLSYSDDHHAKIQTRDHKDELRPWSPQHILNVWYICIYTLYFWHIFSKFRTNIPVRNSLNKFVDKRIK